MKTINSFLSADLQANIPASIDYGPVNNKAFDTGKISAERASRIPSSPKNAAVQVRMDAAWWAKNLPDVQKKWDAFLQE
jgi:putative spermidine/putrescine transport system substrate-binding protein